MRAADIAVPARLFVGVAAFFSWKKHKASGKLGTLTGSIIPRNYTFLSLFKD